MDQPLLWFSLVLIGAFAISILGLHVLVTAPRQRSAQLLAALCFGSVCGRALAWHEYSFWIAPAYRIDLGSFVGTMDLARNLAPGVFMLLCHSLFQDSARVPRTLLLAFVLQLLLERPVQFLLGIDTALQQWHLLEIVPALIELLLLGCGLFWLITGWKADLVEKRRQLRWIFLLIVGTYVFAVVLIERLLIPWQSIASFRWHVALTSFGTTLAVVALFSVLRVGVTRFIDPFAPSEDLTPAAQDNGDLAALNEALNVRRIYRENGLTIGSLAATLRIPEYRLRRLIHEQLGFRNFNALLHHYRVQEACEWLKDGTRRHLPVLTIALSVGYASINPFNRAFRELKGMTPTEFRNADGAGAAALAQKSHANS